MGAKRVNITLPAELHKLLKETADEVYSGNLSRYLTDAGLYYAGVLKGQRNEQQDPSDLGNVPGKTWE